MKRCHNLTPKLIALMLSIALAIQNKTGSSYGILMGCISAPKLDWNCFDGVRAVCGYNSMVLVCRVESSYATCFCQIGQGH